MPADRELHLRILNKMRNAIFDARRLSAQLSDRDGRKEKT